MWLGMEVKGREGYVGSGRSGRWWVGRAVVG